MGCLKIIGDKLWFQAWLEIVKNEPLDPICLYLSSEETYARFFCIWSSLECQSFCLTMSGIKCNLNHVGNIFLICQMSHKYVAFLQFSFRFQSMIPFLEIHCKWTIHKNKLKIRLRLAWNISSYHYFITKPCGIWVETPLLN